MKGTTYTSCQAHCEKDLSMERRNIELPHLSERNHIHELCIPIEVTTGGHCEDTAKLPTIFLETKPEKNQQMRELCKRGAANETNHSSAAKLFKDCHTKKDKSLIG